MPPNETENQQTRESMDISAQFSTYHTSMICLRYVITGTAVSLSLLVMVFCTGAGWGVGLFVAFVGLAIALYFARERKENSWQADVASVLIATENESGQPAINQARVGVGRGTFAMLAISAVMATIAVGAIAARFPHSR